MSRLKLSILQNEIAYPFFLPLQDTRSSILRNSHKPHTLQPWCPPGSLTYPSFSLPFTSFKPILRHEVLVPSSSCFIWSPMSAKSTFHVTSEYCLLIIYDLLVFHTLSTCTRTSKNSWAFSNLFIVLIPKAVFGKLELLNEYLLNGCIKWEPSEWRASVREISQVDLEIVWTLWFSDFLDRKQGIGRITLKVGKPSKTWTILNIRANYSFKLEVMIISLKMKNYAKM